MKSPLLSSGLSFCVRAYELTEGSFHILAALELCVANELLFTQLMQHDAFVPVCTAAGCGLTACCMGSLPTSSHNCSSCGAHILSVA